MFKVNNKDTIMTPMASFCVFIVNIEHISHLVDSVSIVNFEHIIEHVLVSLLLTLT